MNFILKIVEGPNKGAEIALVEGVAVTLGKDDACDVVLADPTLGEAPLKVEASAEGAKAPVVRKLVAAGFAYPEEDADIPGECLFSAAELRKGSQIRFAVTPRDCFGLCGRPLVDSLEKWS